MLKFEIKDREGLGRICALDTRHGKITTPTLLPVINPNQMLFTPKEMRSKFGTEMIITNSYIIKKSDKLRERALSEGVHKLVDFDGPIMTDSGTFQSYVYGEVEVKPDEIINFQRDIGVDVGTALDIFTTPEISHERAKEAVDETLRRVALSAELKGDMALACPVQGSIYPDLREYCASEYAKMGDKCDLFPIGGVVPLMEGYRYRDMAEVIVASKKGLDISKPVHLFGAGHPMVFALAALLGCDMFDSSSYVKFARDGRMMFVDGTRNLSDMAYLPCTCPVCSKYTAEELKKLDEESRAKLLAEHNLYVSFGEIRTIRDAIRAGKLWELVDMRARAHPYLLEGFKSLEKHVKFLEEFAPQSLDSAFFYTSPDSLWRPIAYRYTSRIFERYTNPKTPVVVTFPEGRRPYGYTYKHQIDEVSKLADAHFVVSSIFGPVPIELDEMYPISQSLIPVDTTLLDRSVKERMAELMKEYSHKFDYGLGIVWQGDETLETLRMLTAPVEPRKFDLDTARVRSTADMQFGKGAGDALLDGVVSLVKSKATNRIRNVLVNEEHVLSLRATDGLFSLKLAGAKRLLRKFTSPKLRVIVEDDSAKFNAEGKNVFSRFVKDADPALRPGDEAIIVNEKDELAAVGKLLLNRREMKSFKTGIAVKVRDGLRSTNRAGESLE